MGTDLHVSYMDILRSRTLVERSKDEIRKVNQIINSGEDLVIDTARMLFSSVVAMSPRTPTMTHPQPPLDPELHRCNNYYIHSIYTDGSWAVKHTLSSFLLNTGEVATS